MKKKLPKVNLTVHREYKQRDGIWNPRSGKNQFRGGLQINVFADSEGYFELAEFFRRFAEQEMYSDDHQHFEGIRTVDGNVRLHFILRKDDHGESIWKDCFPQRKRKTRHPTRKSRVRLRRP